MIHHVQQGEHISSIAFTYGFSDWKTIWEHAENASLRELRDNPNVLQPGDTVFIPERKTGQERAESGQRHRFRLNGDPLVLRMRVLDPSGQPLAGASCLLRIGTREQRITADGDGQIETAIQRSDKRGLLIVEEHGIEIPLRIGHLDPVATPSGLRARLANLGYLVEAEAPPSEAGGVGEAGDAQPGPLEDPLLLLAIEEFQCDHELEVDGIFGPSTEARLVEVHGC